MILGYSLNGATCLRLRGYHPLRRRFPAILDFTYGFSLRTSTAALVKQTPQPHTRNPCRVSHVHGLASSDFARHYSRNHFCFLFLWVLRCFTSPRYLRLPYVFRQGRWAITLHRVSPFGNPRIKVWLPTPRGLSQAPTSFIGSWCQGIHRAPLLTWPQKTRCSRPLCSSQDTDSTRPPAPASAGA